MIIVETSIFTHQVLEMLTEEEYRELQLLLVIHPDVGSIITGSGGLRKIRWSAKGHGKRGGSRIIYYWAVIHEKILMLFMYAKNEQDDLSPEQLKVLRKIVEEEYP